MSIIENALKKAGKQGLVIDGDNSEIQTKQPENVDPAVFGYEDSIKDELDGIASNGRSRFVEDKQVVINWSKLAESGFLDNNNTASLMAEEFRVIKRPLVNNIQDAKNNRIERANLILVSSSVEGEGKTFISINLALSLANERDKKILLIDADVERPSLSRQLDIKRSPGLIEFLEDESIGFSDIILKTDHPNLSIIPAGKRHKYSTELLSSQRMRTFTHEISDRYPDRIVIFDSPPLLAATQGHVLSELVGQVVLVISAESTPQSLVAEAIAKLANCDVVMTLLNKTRKDFNLTAGYGYGYGYGYGKYGA